MTDSRQKLVEEVLPSGRVIVVHKMSVHKTDFVRVMTSDGGVTNTLYLNAGDFEEFTRAMQKVKLT